MSGRRFSLPVRRWLALAVVLIFAVPAATFAVAGALEYHNVMGASAAPASLLSSHVSQWNDPAWRARTRAAISRSGASFTLMRAGRIVYSSSSDSFRGVSQLQVQRVTSSKSPGEVAYVYTSGSPWANGNAVVWLLPASGLAALVVTLALLAWFFGRTLVQPLTATGKAARQIAAGELNIEIPDSRIREVADLRSAFDNMSAELGNSLRHQAELEEERRLFIGAIAHDLRTPLFSLRGYLEGIEQGVATTAEKRHEYLRVAREKADTLERLIADLFAYARVEYLEQTVHHDPIDIGATVRTLIEGRRREAEESGVKLQVSISSDAMVVRGDLRLLERALENIIDNALRYTTRGASVHIAAQSDHGAVAITVADSGPGIKPRDLPHVFEPMYRGEGEDGTGLGLAISRRVFVAHGGTLRVDNGELGGAVFTGSLPLSGAPSLVAAQ